MADKRQVTRPFHGLIPLFINVPVKILYNIFNNMQYDLARSSLMTVF